MLMPCLKNKLNLWFCLDILRYEGIIHHTLSIFFCSYIPKLHVWSITNYCTYHNTKQLILGFVCKKGLIEHGSIIFSFWNACTMHIVSQNNFYVKFICFSGSGPLQLGGEKVYTLIQSFLSYKRNILPFDNFFWFNISKHF